MQARPCDNYSRTADGKFACKHCDSVFVKQSNASRHVQEVHFKKSQPLSDDKIMKNKNTNRYTYQTESGIVKPISEGTLKILKWKNEFGISMRAISNKSFKEIVSEPKDVHCRALMHTIQTSIASQMLEQNLTFFKDKVISIILDGGTVIHAKWIAVVGKTDIATKLLDLWIMEEDCTIRNITGKIQQIYDKLLKQRTLIVGACTDNGPNFRGCFYNTVGSNTNDSIKTILRVSCACHSSQLIIKDFLSSDSNFSSLVSTLSEFPNKLSHLTKKKIDELGLTGYPPVMPQRWNSIHISLQYILKNIDVLVKEFPDSDVFKRADYLLEIEEVLAPLHLFTTVLESNECDQSDVFQQYQKLKDTWEMLKGRGNSNAAKLLKFLKNRTETTFDIKLAELAYYFTNEGMNYFAEKFPHYPIHMLDDETIQPYIFERHKKIAAVSLIISEICSVWKIDATIVTRLWCDMTKEKRDFTGKYSSYLDIKQFFPTEQEENILILLNFINRIACLPSSEAESERIFAEMRELFNEKSTHLEAKTLRDELIMSYISKQDRGSSATESEI